ncbi:MAG: MBL fold metallo-hydrolase, partial [Eubacterium sp.]|nr:MBL fold metallo-hydrolase [Eubacterium sp.]
LPNDASYLALCASRLIYSVLNDHIKHISLAHLSDKNNYPELAFEAVKQELEGNIYSDDVRDFGLCIAPRYERGELVEL